MSRSWQALSGAARQAGSGFPGPRRPPGPHTKVQLCYRMVSFAQACIATTRVGRFSSAIREIRSALRAGRQTNSCPDSAGRSSLTPLRQHPMTVKIVPTQRETFFDPDTFIVSKTDLKGRMTYANKTFCDIAGYSEKEILGKPHSLIRHPDMPRAVFKLLWDTIQDGREVFAYVKNMARNGDHYWVFAHVTPSYDSNLKVCGYHSNRRVPKREVVESILPPFYAELTRIESSYRNAKEGLAASYQHLMSTVTASKSSYDEFIFSL